MRNGSIIVQKYGGSSVSTVDKLKQVARLVATRAREGHRMVVVVSAMGDATDELLAKAQAVAGEPDRRELDMLLSVGERISMSLLAMAIREEGLEAVSLTGSQSGIITTASHAQARIMEVRPFRVEDELDAGRVVIVAGYQGVSYKREVTTLGRGGSDTTAVALAAALSAEACEIYSDVEGVFTADPRVVPDATPLAELGYAEMQELAEAGAKVLNAQAVEFAKQKNIAIYARKTGSEGRGTVVRLNAPVAPSGVRGIAHERAVATVEASGVSLAQAREALDAMDALGATPRQLNLAGGCFSCVLGTEDLHEPRTLEARLEAILGPGVLSTGRGAVSLIGEGITRHAHVMRAALDAAAEVEAEVLGVATSSFRITLLVPSLRVEPLTRALHAAVGLGPVPALPVD
ncbi:MAG: aspartate kinase [Deltaproteobacteria bacterium]|nr:aspartate kinase [Deltaproteobacteria bacterium]